jgi:hypothetical protein
MTTMIAQPARETHAIQGTSSRQRADRLARATIEQMQAALAFISVLVPEAFDIAFTAIAPDADDLPEDDEAEPLCRTCGAPAGIFPEHGLEWVHYRGDGITAGARHIFDPGHSPEVAWYLPGELPDDS